jgi:hypothetical protein
MPSEKKRHHYLPQFYQDNFTDSQGYLWIYDRNDCEYRRQQPINTAVIGHYYRFEKPNGEFENGIEDYLSAVEGLSRPVIDKLLRKERITIEEKKIITFFIALSRVRVPRFEKVIHISRRNLIRDLLSESLSNEKDAKEVINGYEGEMGEKLDLEPKELLNAFSTGSISVTERREIVLDAMYPAAISISKRIYKMTWFALFPPKDCSFITSDNPFVVVKSPTTVNINIDEKDLFPDGTKIFFPLHSNACLALENLPVGNKFFNISKKAVREINIVSAMNSERFIISRDELLLRSIINKAKVFGNKNK